MLVWEDDRERRLTVHTLLHSRVEAVVLHR
jgi:hypothetical protein